MNFIKNEASLGTTRDRRCSDVEVTASHGISHANNLRLQYSRHLNQTKPSTFLPNLASGGSQLNFAAGKPSTEYSAPLEFV